MTTKQIADYALMLSDQDAEIKVLKAEIAALRERNAELKSALGFKAPMPYPKRSEEKR